MKRRLDCWDIVPVRLILGGLAAAGACAAAGILVPALHTMAVLIYGTLAVGLLLYGLCGSVAAPFKEGIHHGIACLLLPGIYPIYFNARYPGSGWKPLVNMILGFALAWAAVQTFPMFRRAEARPARPRLAAGVRLEGIGPSRTNPDPPGAGPLAATTAELAGLLAGVTDEPSAREASPRYRQLMARRRAEFEAAGEPRAIDDRGEVVSLSALIALGPRFRDANREFQAHRKRIRRIGGLLPILEGTH